jgi:hypothetical protein
MILMYIQSFVKRIMMHLPDRSPCSVSVGRIACGHTPLAPSWQVGEEQDSGFGIQELKAQAPAQGLFTAMP